MKTMNVMGAALLLALSASSVWASTPAAPAKKRPVHKSVVIAPSAPDLAPATLTPEQMAWAQRVVVGVVPCELSQKVSVEPHPQHAGHFVVQSGKQRFAMVPVPTSTGAVRLEDTSAGAVWLQLANKSMLMDQKNGRRLADACANPEQQAVALAMEKNPAPSLLEPLPVATPPGSAMK